MERCTFSAVGVRAITVIGTGEELTMRSTIRMALVALAVILPLSSCGSSNLPMLETTKTDDSNYRLGPGDKLHIQVLGAEDLTGDYAVRSEERRVGKE